MGYYPDLRGRVLAGDKVVIGYSGGPDAAALAHFLKCMGADIVPVYINYRKVSGGGKIVKDLRAVYASAELLDLLRPVEIRMPLGIRPKNRRNRFFVEVLARIAKRRGAKYVALGTIKAVVIGERGYTNDLDPAKLYAHGKKRGVEVITWDTLGAHEKADEFYIFGEEKRKALFATTSCQLWWHVECGNCESCINRHLAFMKAFGYDPTVYHVNSKIVKASAR